MNTRNKIFTLIIEFSLLILLVSGCAAPSTAAPTASQEAAASAAPSETTAAPAQTVSSVSIDGRWEGSLTVAGSSLNTIITFSTEDDALKASLDIPQQNLFGYPLVNVSFDGSRVYFEGLEETGRKAVWDGSLQDDGKISGSFSQAGYTGTFELTPAENTAADNSAADNTAASAEPLPYKAEDVAVKNGEITLGGTLTEPEGEGPFPAVVMISGSGAQNRDEEVFGFKMFAVIADQLTRNGIAVLRCDDRGVGASTGDLANSTSAELAGDVLTWVEYLKTRSEIDPQKIGLMGHSEGGIIAPLAASQSDDISFVVLMASPAIIGEEIIYSQIEAIARASGVSEEVIAKSLEMQHRIFDGLIRGKNWEGAKAEIRQQIADQVNALSDDQKKALGDLDRYIDTVYQQQIATLESKWYRYFLEYDPAPVLEKTAIPVLALFGELDVQVPADPNADMMKAALEKAGNTNVTIITYPKANHLLQEAVTGSPTEYAALKPEFTPGFLDDLTNWILETVSSGK